jgi:hypothetical protein
VAARYAGQDGKFSDAKKQNKYTNKRISKQNSITTIQLTGIIKRVEPVPS